MGFWWATVPKQSWPSHPQFQEYLGSRWDGTWGDRRQELVFIGSGMDEGYIRASLDACLSHSENGFDLQSWRNLKDPFPPWHYPDQKSHTGAAVR
jgi:hypothetical protein